MRRTGHMPPNHLFLTKYKNHLIRLKDILDEEMK